MTSTRRPQLMSSSLLVVASLVVTIAGMKMAAELLVPFLLACYLQTQAKEW